jgi:hypothetical protein
MTTTTTTTTTTSSTTIGTTTGSTTPEQEAHCESPVARQVLSDGQGKLINVSSIGECCASCTSNCTYVTYGKYKADVREQYACFLHAHSFPEEIWLTSFLAIQDAEDSSCDALGLSDCAGASVKHSPLPVPQSGGVGLPLTGVASFGISAFLGVVFSQWMGLGNRLLKATL